jgi:hypothetical protein
VILIDTGPIVAFFDKDDRFHAVCTDILKEIHEPLMTTWPVITECFFLLDFSWQVQEDLWTFLLRGGIDIHPLQKEHRMKCRDLMKRYHDLPMDLADATLVALADALNVSKVFTLDHKDFSVYRFQQKKQFTLIPSSLVS